MNSPKAERADRSNRPTLGNFGIFQSISHPKVTMLAPFTTLEQYAPVLHQSMLGSLPLTDEQRKTYQVISLSPEIFAHPGAGDTHTGRLVLAKPLPRAEWGTIPCGKMVVYTERYVFPERDEYAEGTSALVTHLGEMRRYDAKRGVFYATSIEHGMGYELDFADAEITEAWVVEKFLSVAA